VQIGWCSRTGGRRCVDEAWLAESSCVAFYCKQQHGGIDRCRAHGPHGASGNPPDRACQNDSVVTRSVLTRSALAAASALVHGVNDS
jgi:hypothetical protein